jgi:endoglucanase
MVAIARLVSAACAGHGDPASMPHVAAASDYYSAALTLLARLAWRDLALPLT